MRALVLISCFLISSCLAFAQQGNSMKLFRSGQLPAEMGRYGSFVFGTRLYVIGGEDNVGRRLKTYSAIIQPTGLLGVWRDENPLPEKRAGIQNAVTLVGNRVYIVGGMGAQGKPGKPGFERLNSVIWTE